MNTSIEINDAVEMRLTEALLIYRHSHHRGSTAAYVTHHEVNNGQLGPAKPLTDAFLARLSEEMERKVKVEILPEKVLVRTPETIVWWTPATRRRMYFIERRNEESLADLNGREYAQPPLVWMVHHDRLYLRAMQSSERPNAQTKLYRAPYWNIDERGDVCEGDMPRPDTTSVATIDKWEEGFYQSRFSHPNATKLVEWPRPYTDFVRNLLMGAECFPCGALVDAHQTLQQFSAGGR